MSPTRWLLYNDSAYASASPLEKESAAIGAAYFNTINSYITNGNESIIDPQLKSHQYHINAGCDTLRTFTEYVTPSMINSPERLKNILNSSVYTGYHMYDQKAMTFEGIFGGIKPVEIAANIGPLVSTNNDKETLCNEYEQIIQILAPCLDILWIQHINNLQQLHVIMDIAKMYKDDEQIWINVDSSLLKNGGHQLFDLLVEYNPGAIIVVGNDWKEINANLVLVNEYTKIEGGTKFGVIVDKLDDTDLNKEQVTPYGHHGWDDELLSRATQFWIEQGVSVIGCEWESGLKIVQKQAATWNATIG
eukprot:1052660_1